VSVDLVAVEHRHRRRELSRAATAAARDLWAQVDPGRLDDWLGLLPEAHAAVSGAQLAAAAAADDYLDRVLVAQGLDTAAVGRLAPRALAGVASDGRRLDTLLAQPLIATKTLIGSGVPVERAMATGQAGLELIATTQVADAGRVADQVAVTARPAATGYVRMVVGRSCARCIMLAGRVYRWNRGFARHPGDDCVHIPTAEALADDIRIDPVAVFEAMTEVEQNRVFGRANAQAIRDGADLASVVNARRGMYVAGRRVRATREGVTVRGLFGGYEVDPVSGQLRRRPASDLIRLPGQRVRSTPTMRLMPEQIYLEAGDDRSEALRLLRLHGYLLGQQQPRRSAPAPIVDRSAVDETPVVDLVDVEPDHTTIGAPADPLEGIDLQTIAEDELYDLFARVSALDDVDGLVLLRLTDEMDRREQPPAVVVADPEPPPVENWLAGPVNERYDWPDPDEQTAEQRHLNELIDQGWDYQEAYAEAYGLDVADLARQERLATLDRHHGESIDQAVRRAYDEWVHLEYLDAEAATRGHMLTAEGVAAGIDPRTLWSGNLATARRYASEDLLRWWSEHPRKNLTQFKAELLGREQDIQAAERTRLASNDRDFI
jgi:hypothetical protein